MAGKLGKTVMRAGIGKGGARKLANGGKKTSISKSKINVKKK